MLRTGVFLCTCNKKLNLNFKEIAKQIKDKVKFVEIVDRLCTPEGKGYVAQHLRWADERRPGSIVIAACDSKNRVFVKLMEEYNFSPRNMVIENIREQCAWVHNAERDKSKATEKAKTIVKGGVIKAKYLRTPETAKAAIDKSIALMGAKALAIAPILKNFGASLQVIEKEGYLKREVGADAEFNFYPASEVVEIKGRLGDFEITLKRKKYIDREKCISCDACMAACEKKAVYSPEDALFHSYAITDKCDSCGACLKACPVNAISIEEKIEKIKAGQIIACDSTDIYTAALRAISNLTMKEKEILIRTDLKKCANAELREKKLNITGCSYCTAACAYGAISCGEIDEISCVGCGICASACPQGVPQLRSLPEEEIFSLIEAALDTKLSPKVLLFSCTEYGRAVLHAAGVQKLEYPAVSTVFVPCIGMISDVHILRAFDLGCDGVLLLGCGKCKYKNGAREAAKAVAFCKQMLSAFGIEKERVKIVSTDNPQKFADAVKKFAEELASSLPPLKNKPAEFNDLLGEEKSKREMLLGLLQNFSKIGIKSREVKGDYAFGSVIADKTKCTLCAACASICTTGALTSTSEDLPTMTFTHAYCIACGICEKICPEKALKVEKVLELERFVDAMQEEIKVELVKCKSCGRPLMAATAYRKLSGTLNKEGAEFLGLCRECKLNFAPALKAELHSFKLNES